MIKGKPPRLSRIYLSQPLYFVTLCTLYRQPLLTNSSIHETFRRYCKRAGDHNVAVGATLSCLITSTCLCEEVPISNLACGSRIKARDRTGRCGGRRHRGQTHQNLAT